MTPRPYRRHKLMTLEDASDKLVVFFPELREAFDREVEWWRGETPGAYIVYEGLFYRYVEKRLESKDAEALQRVFDFVEFVITAEDTRLHDLIRISILTRLTVEPVLSAEARRYMQPLTKLAFRQVRRG
jgi:hypothetical protein